MFTGVTVFASGFGRMTSKQGVIMQRRFEPAHLDGVPQVRFEEVRIAMVLGSTICRPKCALDFAAARFPLFVA